VTLSAEFTDPRLVAAYDTLNVYEPGTQPDFYLELARESARARSSRWDPVQVRIDLNGVTLSAVRDD
jgi:hypothetical protein